MRVFAASNHDRVRVIWASRWCTDTGGVQPAGGALHDSLLDVSANPGAEFSSRRDAGDGGVSLGGAGSGGGRDSADFTGQVWNMAFSFYVSLKSIPKEMHEAAKATVSAGGASSR
jgi:hypothetical protein